MSRRVFCQYVLVSMAFSVVVTLMLRGPETGFLKPFLFVWGLTFVSLLVEQKRQAIIRQCREAQADRKG